METKVLNKRMNIDEVPYTESEDILGMPIVGYRYGEAPEEGRSYNHRDREYEPGVSLAQWGLIPEIFSFAISDVWHLKRDTTKALLLASGVTMRSASKITKRSRTRVSTTAQRVVSVKRCLPQLQDKHTEVLCKCWVLASRLYEQKS